MLVLAPAASAALVRGTGGNDTLTGTPARDRIFARAGDDSVLAGDDRDRVWGGAGNDTLNGEASNDLVVGGAGNDVVDGGDGNDRLRGRRGDDRLTAGAGNDRVWAGVGADILDGGDGDGRLFAAANDGTIDTITCGEGTDRVVARPDDSVAVDCENVVRVGT
jgi:Ca2+-binding RTX toxin-like protein